MISLRPGVLLWIGHRQRSRWKCARVAEILMLGMIVPAVVMATQGADVSNLFAVARSEFQDKHYGAAENSFREVLRQEPSNIHAQVYLGQALFNQGKYGDAIMPYERARELDHRARVLSPDQKRILTDQLAMSYGINGELAKARSLLGSAIKADPEYPLNYYNLACAMAEEGNKEGMLANLALAFERKGNVLKGERMPDPRSDSSFQKYLQDEKFMKLMEKLGYR